MWLSQSSSTFHNCFRETCLGNNHLVLKEGYRRSVGHKIFKTEITLGCMWDYLTFVLYGTNFFLTSQRIQLDLLIFKHSPCSISHIAPGACLNNKYSSSWMLSKYMFAVWFMTDYSAIENNFPYDECVLNIFSISEGVHSNSCEA